MAAPDDGDEPVTAAPKRPPRCPMCGRPRHERFRPFCSAACRDRDLLNWLGGRYAIPAIEVEDDGGEEGPHDLPDRD
jgi:endogenous inhibitor of DNA gyrase (YacG/DUF329 family)